MDLQKDISDNQIALIILSKENYPNQILDVQKAVADVSNKSCYVCLNSPYSTVESNLQKNGVDSNKFFFIDTLTSQVKTPEEIDNAIFISAPNALTELSVAFSKALNEVHTDNALFDSLSTLLVYEKAHSIIQFMHNIITKLRVANSKAVFICLKEDVGSELIKDLHMFVDKVVEMG